MPRHVRRASLRLSGTAALAAATLLVLPTAQGHAAAPPAGSSPGVARGHAAEAAAVSRAASSAGARTPFTTVEAESGALHGGAAVKSIKPGDPGPTAASLATEASGYAYVELGATGDSVTLRNTTGKRANTLVVRASIPDAPNGGGLDATLDLYVDGAFRQKVNLDSHQSWNYRGATTNADDPHAGGMPYRFYNDFPLWVSGAPIAPGATLTLKKDADNTAAVYDVDSVDLENVGHALTRPAGSLSVLDYGADPTFTTDSTVAIQSAVDDARAQGRSVWIPPGKYLTNSLAGTPLNFTGVKVQGAGMWHTTLYRKVPLPTPSGWRSEILVGSGTTLTDIQIDANAVWRGVFGNGGSDYGVNASGAGGWHIDRIWTRHTDANWLSGSHGLVENSRTSDSYGDGFNINNSNVANPDKLGYDITVRNNFARNTGDDSFAVYSDSGTAGTDAQLVGARVLHNTAVAPWWANGLRIAGGIDVVMKDNLVNSVSTDSAMDIGVFGNTGNPLESATVTGNVLIGGGGWNGVGLRHGVKISSPSPTSNFPDATTNVTFNGNVLIGSLHAGLYIDRAHVNATVTHNIIEGPAEQGILINSQVYGTGVLSANVVKGLLPGQAAFQNNSPDTFTITR